MADGTEENKFNGSENLQKLKRLWDRVWKPYRWAMVWTACFSLLNYVSSSGNWELRIDFTFSNGTKLFMHYNHVRVGPSTDNYRLSMLGVTGITSEDPFTAGHFMNGQQFST